MHTGVAFGTMPALDVFDGRDIDLVVTDAKLPAGESDGSALARMIRNKRPQVPIIMLIAHPEAHDVTSRCVARCKPSEIAELCRAIRVRQTQ
jgi:DNA-binding response OmpR family regulator